jgi:hypothetical protein
MSNTPKKAKRKGPLHFEIPAIPERTHVLFTWGEKEFLVYESKDISPLIMATALEMLEDNPLSAMTYTFKETLGDEQYKEFTKLNLSPESFKAITAEVMEHLASAFVEEEVEEEGKA